MKKTIVVTIIKELEIEIEDALLTSEAMKGFSGIIFPVTEPYEIFFHVAKQVAQNGCHFVEGVGNATWFIVKKPSPIKFEDCNISIECEEM